MGSARLAIGGGLASGISPNGDRVIFRQLFDPETSSYTYLLADSTTDQALLIDPVLEQIDRDCSLLSELGLELRLTLETHLHADHITASGQLRQSRRITRDLLERPAGRFRRRVLPRGQIYLANGRNFGERRLQRDSHR